MVLVKSLYLQESQASYLKDQVISGVCDTFQGSEVDMNLVGTSLVPPTPAYFRFLEHKTHTGNRMGAHVSGTPGTLGSDP